MTHWSSVADSLLCVAVHESFMSKNTCATADGKTKKDWIGFAIGWGLNIADADLLKNALIVSSAFTLTFLCAGSTCQSRGFVASVTVCGRVTMAKHTKPKATHSANTRLDTHTHT